MASSDDSKQAAKKLRLDKPDTETDDSDKENPFLKGNYTDEIELKFDNKKSLFVSKGFLSYASPVFKRMFQSDFQEKQAKNVQLTGKSYDAFFEMLLFLHPRIQKPISTSSSTAINVYRLAHEYDIPSALNGTRNIILQNTLSISIPMKYAVYFSSHCGDLDDFFKQLFELLVFGKTYQDAAISNRAAERLSILPMKSVEMHPSYAELPEESKRLIMLYRLKRVDDDNVHREELELDLLN